MWAFDLCVADFPTLSGLGGDSGLRLDIGVRLLHGGRIYVFTVSKKVHAKPNLLSEIEILQFVELLSCVLPSSFSSHF